MVAQKELKYGKATPELLKSKDERKTAQLQKASRLFNVSSAQHSHPSSLKSLTLCWLRLALMEAQGCGDMLQ